MNPVELIFFVSVLLLLYPFHAVLLSWILSCLLSDSISTPCCICFLMQNSTQHTEWAEQLSWYSIGLKSQVQCWCWFDFLMWQVFSQSQLSVQIPLVFEQHLCGIARINICVHVKNPQHWQPYYCLDMRKYWVHWKEWVALLLQQL